MINEEAIKIIKAYKDRLTNSCSNQLGNDIEAFDLAINALEEAEDWHNLKLVCANDGIVVYKVRDEE